MYRQGRYTRKPGPIRSTKRFLKRRYEWWKKLKLWQKIAVIVGPILALLLAIAIGTYVYYYNDIGNKERLLNRNNTGVILLDKNGKAFYTTPGSRVGDRDIVPLGGIADVTEHALLASEDKDFYKHGGFSVAGYARAAVTGVGGGSTLTQQLAKNTLLNNEHSYLRKFQELTLAMAIEQRYSKDEILDMYLNSVFFGENSFGIEAAAHTYFGKKPSQLTLAESAMLVGVLPAPSAYSPISGDPTLAKERQTTVLSRMVKNGYITEEQKTAALKETLHYKKQTSAINNSAPHFTEMVLNELYKKYGEEKVTRSGFQVKTTLDLKLQDAANKSVDDNIAYIQSQGGSNASLVAIDPKNGGIRALVGSYDYNDAKFGKVNMATTARQPGSSFKPIYYSEALAEGVVTPVTVFNDAKITDLGDFSPQNADRSYHGKVTVRQALDWSLNIPSVRVMEKLGINESIQAAKDLGITTLDESKNYGLPLALGAAEVPLVEMTSAYSAFANAGEQHAYNSVQSIKDKFDRTIFTASDESHRAISEQGSYLISNILSDNATRSRVFGSSLNVQGTDYQTKTVAVKTGTTDDNRDAWTIGYTPEMAVGVWVGNNDNAPMYNGGSGMAGPIWREMMQIVIGTKNPSFVQPSGITKATVCTEVGTLTDVFLSNHVPTECKKTTVTKKKTEQPKKTEMCAVAGKEDLTASDPNCVEEMCTYQGLEDLAANDPNCVDPSVTDSDNDGVMNDVDQCSDTAAGASVDAVGCSADQTPAVQP